MQVNLSTSLPNSAGEAVTAKPAEKADNESAGTFFAHMGRVWNPDNGSSDAQTEKKSGEQVSDTTANVAASLPAANSAGPEQVSMRNVSGSASQASLDSDAANASTQTARGQAAAEDSNNPKLPGAAEFMRAASTISDSKASVFQGPDSNSGSNPGDSVSRSGDPDSADDSRLHKDADPYDASVREAVSREAAESAQPESGAFQTLPFNSHQESRPRSELNRMPAELNFAGDFRTSRDSNVPGENSQAAVGKKLEDAVYAALENRGTGGSRDEGYAARNEPVSWKTAENAQLESGVFQILPVNSRQESHSRSELNSVSKDLNFAGDLLTSRDPNVPGENSRTAVGNKLENAIYAAFANNTDTGDSHADQDVFRNPSVAWMALTGKPGNSQLETGRLPAPATERHNEVFSASASSPTRLAESDGAWISGATETTASQPKDFLFQLAERIQILVRDGQSEIRISLKPDGLGHLEIRAETTANGVVARIVAESGNVKDYLEHNLHLLQQNLQDQGLKVDRIHVAVQDGLGPQSSSGHTPQFSHTGAGNDGHAPRGSSGLSVPTAAKPEDSAIDPIMYINLGSDAGFHAIA
jgi:flagellar hook-length control protein FliK